jgi:hypothetical protein
MSSMSANSSWSPFHFKNVPPPLGNVDPKFVNVTNSNDPKNFGSNETNRQWGLSGASNNAQAAAASALKGGAKTNTKSKSKAKTKTLRKKIKNIATKYKKMKGKRMTLGFMKRKFSKLFRMKSKSKKNTSRKHRRGTRKQRGGYSQYMSNVPTNASYSTGGHLSPNLSALANPPIIKTITNNCVDNYNHFTGKGSPSP